MGGDRSAGVSPVPRQARAFQGRRAGVVSRLAAAAIDAAVVGGVLAVGYATIAGLSFMLDPRSFTFPRASLAFNMTAAFAVTVSYLALAWGLVGKSYGKVVMGLRVVGPRGRKLRLPGALLRAVGCTVFPIGLLWCAVSIENRSLQDLLLRTSVVYDW
jgi:uncharacterized RDD family membrane protein YckC